MRVCVKPQSCQWSRLVGFVTRYASEVFTRVASSYMFVIPFREFE